MRSVALYITGLLLLAEACAEGTLTSVRFVGNETTRPEVMLQEMTIRPGDPVDSARIEESRQAIMNLGLFKSVQADLREEPEGTVLLVTVDEKWYILPIPRAGLRADGDTEYGAELRFDNLFGLNQRLELEYLVKDSVDSDESLRREWFVGYSYPRIIGTPYQLDASAGLIRREVRQKDQAGMEIGQYQQDSRNFRLGLFRWHTVPGPSRGLRYGGGTGVQQEVYYHLNGAPVPLPDATNVAVNALVEFVDVNEEQYRRRGRVYGYSVERGIHQLGDFSYQRHLFYYRRHLLLDQGRSNLDYRFQLGMADGAPFGADAWSLGGSNTLRGFERDYITGNAMLLSNIEYLFPVSGYPQMRGVLFSDIGYAWPSVSALNLYDLKASVGIGLRWRVQLFVNTTLRADYAWGLEPDTRVAYFGTRTMF